MPFKLPQLGLCWDPGHSCGREALSPSHGYHLLCALLTGFLFASRLPERLAPGRFDFIGESRPRPPGRGRGEAAFPAVGVMARVLGEQAHPPPHFTGSSMDAGDRVFCTSAHLPLPVILEISLSYS